MCRCESRNHPQLPKSCVSLWLDYCHNCFAWKLTAMLWVQDDGDSTHEDVRREIEFGPFDTLEEVTAAAKASLSHLMLAPGRPWDSGGTKPRDDRPAAS